MTTRMQRAHLEVQVRFKKRPRHSIQWQNTTKMFPFQSFSSHTSTVHKELPVQQVICKRKQNLQMCRAPGARTAQGGKHHKKSWGSCIHRPAHKGRRIPERGQKRSKQLSPQTLINLGLCCHTESRKAWWKSNAATGTEVNVKRAGALEQERSTRLRGIAHLHRRAKVLHHPLCCCTTAQQFSHKPSSALGNAHRCTLARDECVLLTSKTTVKHYKDGKAIYCKRPLPSHN